jgi:ABC-type dipeptide/oligopeptide/nickel transport system permease subunit
VSVAVVSPVVSGEISRAGQARRAWWAYPRLTQGVVLLTVLLVLTIGAPLFTTYGPLDQHLTAALRPPGGEFLLGTDQLGRDVFSRCLYGGRLVLAVALIAVIVSMVVGVLVGLLSGYLGGAVDTAIMRVMDGLIVFPDLILALAITYALGPSFGTVAAAISVVNVPMFARVVRAQVLSLRERDFVASAKVSGASTSRVLSRHLLPNVVEVTIVQAALTGGSAIFTAASLSFLGLGLPPPAPDWGGMLHDGYPFLGYLPLMSLMPGFFIFVAMLSFNLVGDGMRDLFDPKVLPHGASTRSRRRRANAATRSSGAVQFDDETSTQTVNTSLKDVAAAVPKVREGVTDGA